MEAANYHHKIIIVNSVGSKMQPIRIHTMLFREVLMALGYSLKTAQKITHKTFTHFFKDNENLSELLIEKEVFVEHLTDIHSKNKLEIVKKFHSYFFSIIKLRLKPQGVIILIGGASGSGKSSVTSLLAGRMHLKEMSTDNVRHIMRNFISKAESPFIFSSTYESDHLIKDPNLTLEEKVIEAYLRQCREVQRELKKVLEYYHRTGVWIIVEGVHLTPDFILECMKSFSSCFGCIICVEDPEKYKNRFASRSSKNSIKPEDNKYIQGFEKIMMIQSYLTKQAEEKLIPKIHNTNLDTSYCMIHRSFLKNLKLIGKKPLVEADSNNAAEFHEQFVRTSELLKKAKKIKEYMKMSKIENLITLKSQAIDAYTETNTSDPTGALTLDRVKELEPLSKENHHMILVLPKLPSDGQIKTIKALIKKANPEDPVKVHWVGTDKRTVIFKTDQSHSNELFLYDYVLEKDEVIERLMTDPVSKKKIFSKAKGGSMLDTTITNTKSIKKPKKGDEDSDQSFESIKKAARKKRNSVPKVIHFTNLKKNLNEQDMLNYQENSIDKLGSETDSQHNEVGRLYPDLRHSKRRQ